MVALRSSGVSLVVFYSVFLCLGFAAVILRFVSIRILHRQIKAHDWFCVISLVCLTAYCIMTIIGTIEGGIGEHIDQVPPAQLKIALKTFFASQFFWATSISTFRLAMLYLYMEIFTIPLFRYCAYTSASVIGLFYIGSLTTSLRMCQPLAFNWDKTLSGSCGNIGIAELAAAAINMALDIWIVLLPIPVIWRLQMSKQKKIGVTATFALGLGIAGINLARIIKVVDCNLLDFTYCTRDSAILTVAEMAFGIVAACIPTLGPIMFPGRYNPSLRKRYKIEEKSLTGSRADARLRYKDDTFDGQIVQKSGMDDVELGENLHHGRSKAYIYAHTDSNEAPNGTVGNTGMIGVRREIEITRNVPQAWALTRKPMCVEEV